MYERILVRLRKFDRRKQVILLGALALVVILAVLLIAQISKPERSVAAYCKVYEQEKSRLDAIQLEPIPVWRFQRERERCSTNRNLLRSA
jgi:hypothetical protein